MKTIRRAAVEPRERSLSRWSYYVAVDEVYHARWTGKQAARLEIVRQAVKHLWPKGYPVKLIQVAGTSGKGSTCLFIQAGLSEFGKAGCYVKPHVFDYAERFVVGNNQVGYDEITRTWQRDIRPYCVESALKLGDWSLDHFEASLLLALKIFERRRLEWGVIETGMGGRYDPVSALDVVATVVTNVGQDHEDALGGEHWQRALEKGGVCRSGIPLFTADTDPRSVEVLKGLCDDAATRLHVVGPKEVERVEVVVRGRRGGGGQSLLGSDYQLRNAALAFDVVSWAVAKADLGDVVDGFLKAKFVGRFWPVESGVFADVAHNPSKTQALSEDLKSKFPRTKLIFVVGITGNRDPVAVLGPLMAQAKAVVVTTAGFKGQDPDKVYTRLRDAYPQIPMHLAPNPRTTLSVAKGLRNRGETILFTGSTYMIDQALNSDEYLRHLNGTVGWRDVRQKQIAGTVSFSIPERS